MDTEKWQESLFFDTDNSVGINIIHHIDLPIQTDNKKKYYFCFN